MCFIHWLLQAADWSHFIIGWHRLNKKKKQELKTMNRDTFPIMDRLKEKDRSNNIYLIVHNNSADLGYSRKTTICHAERNQKMDL